MAMSLYNFSVHSFKSPRQFHGNWCYGYNQICCMIKFYFMSNYWIDQIDCNRKLWSDITIHWNVDYVPGAIRDASTSYSWTFYFAGALFTAAGLVHYLLPLVERWVPIAPADADQFNVYVSDNDESVASGREWCPLPLGYSQTFPWRFLSLPDFWLYLMCCLLRSPDN